MISVVISTHNRSASLKRTLESLKQIAYPSSTPWELIIVASACTDDTSSVCKPFSADLPMRMIQVIEPGLSRARNAGLDEAGGEHVIFVDDDLLFSTRWLLAYAEAFDTYPDIAFFGGPIEPLYFGGKRPKWLSEDIVSHLLAGLCCKYELGAIEMEVNNTREMPYGGNCAVKREILLKQKFREDLGLVGKGRKSREETEMFSALLKSGQKGRYLPDARVRHFTDVKRFRLGFMMRYYAGSGASKVAAGHQKRPHASRWNRCLPNWYIRRLLKDTVAVLVRSCLGKNYDVIKQLVSVSERWGMVCEWCRS